MLKIQIPSYNFVEEKIERYEKFKKANPEVSDSEIIKLGIPIPTPLDRFISKEAPFYHKINYSEFKDNLEEMVNYVAEESYTSGFKQGLLNGKEELIMKFDSAFMFITISICTLATLGFIKIVEKVYTLLIGG